MSQATKETSTNTAPTLSSQLLVKGPLRIRPYGNVKHAHVVLKKVAEEEYVDTNGVQRRRGVFSLFAHKLINVKAGKELFLSVHGATGDLEAAPVALEGILAGEDETPGEEVREIPKPEPPQLPLEEPVVQHKPAVPPKMRKAWARKSDIRADSPSQSITAISVPALITPPRAEIGVQTILPTSSVQVQTTPSLTSVEVQTSSPSRLSTEVQTDVTIVEDVGTDCDELVVSTEAGMQTLDWNPTSIIPLLQDINSAAAEPAQPDDMSLSPSDTHVSLIDPVNRRSSSPMELESQINSPLYSPSATPITAHVGLPSVGIDEEQKVVPQAAQSRSISVLSNDSDIRSSRAATPDITRDIQNCTETKSPQPSVPLTGSSSSTLISSTPSPENEHATARSESARESVTPMSSALLLAPAPTPAIKPILLNGSPQITHPTFVPARVPSASTSTLTLDLKGVAELAKPVSGGTQTQWRADPFRVQSPQAYGPPPPPTLPPKEPPPATSSSTKPTQPPTGPAAYRKFLEPVKFVKASNSPLTSAPSVATPPTAPQPPTGPRATRGLGGGSESQTVEGQCKRIYAEMSNLLRHEPTRQNLGAVWWNWVHSFRTKLSALDACREELRAAGISDPGQSEIVLAIKDADLHSREVWPFGTPFPPLAQRPLYARSTYEGVFRAIGALPPAPSQPEALNRPSAPAALRGVQPFVPAPIIPHPPSQPPPEQPKPPGGGKWQPISLRRPPAVKQEPLSPVLLTSPMPFEPPLDPEMAIGWASSPDTQVKKSDETSVSLPPTPKPSSSMSPVVEQQPTTSVKQEQSQEPQVTPGRKRKRFSQAKPSEPSEPSSSNGAVANGDAEGSKNKPIVIDLSLPAKPVTTVPVPTSPSLLRVNLSQGHGSVTMKKITSASITTGGNTGIRWISFNSTGSMFALICNDHTVRIWNNAGLKKEVAKLAHNAAVVSIAWMDRDAGVVSLGSNGVVNRWTNLGQNSWHWAKILDCGDAEPTCMAYQSDRIAVAYGRIGVRVWIWSKGAWNLRRTISRTHVATVKFVEDGTGVVCGNAEGYLFFCSIPDGDVEPYIQFSTKVFQFDMDHDSQNALVAQAGGRTHLIRISRNDNMGKPVQIYHTKEIGAHNSKTNYAFGAIFAGNDNLVVFGSIGGRVLVWNKDEGKVLCELDHGRDAFILSAANYDRGSEGTLVTGSSHGRLTWWSITPSDQPVTPTLATPQGGPKRRRVN